MWQKLGHFLGATLRGNFQPLGEDSPVSKSDIISHRELISMCGVRKSENGN